MGARGAAVEASPTTGTLFCFVWRSALSWSTRTEHTGSAPYALPRGVPALQTEPARVRMLVVVCVLLALLGGGLTGYMCA